MKNDQMINFRNKFGLTQEQTADVLGYWAADAIRKIELGSRKLSPATQKTMEYYSMLSNKQQKALASP